MADSKVKDMGLAEFGRKELALAEHEMPGLMNCRKEFGAAAPFKGPIRGIFMGTSIVFSFAII